MVFHSPGRITIGDPTIKPPRLPLGFDDPYSHGYTEQSAGIHVSYSASGDLIGGFRVFDCDLVVTQQVYDLLISKVADLRRRAIEHEYPAFSAWANELEGRLITVSAPA